MVGLLENSVQEVKTVDTLEMTASILDVVAEDADAITPDNQVLIQPFKMWSIQRLDEITGKSDSQC